MKSATIHIHPAVIDADKPEILDELILRTGMVAVLKRDGRALLMKLKQRSIHTEQTAC